MVELSMRKRKALPGEIGLFPAGEVWEEEFQNLKIDTDVSVVATVEANAKYNRLSWHIANLVCQAREEFETPQDARDAILIACRHFEMKAKKLDKLRDEMRMVPKPTRTLDGTEWLKLIKRMVHVATTVYAIPESEISRNPDYMATTQRAAPPREEPPPVDTIPDGPPAPTDAERAAADLAAEQDEDRSPYTTVTHGLRGFFAVLMHWDEEGGFWEPWMSGIGSFESTIGAIKEADEWARAEGIRCIIPDGAPAQLRAPREQRRPMVTKARDMDEEEPEGDTVAAAPTSPPPPAPARDSVVWAVDMPGEPDWSIDMPGDNGMYAAYFRAKLAKAGDAAGFIVWFNSDEQWNLRQACKVSVENRTAFKQQMSEKFGVQM